MVIDSLFKVNFWKVLLSLYFNMYLYLNVKLFFIQSTYIIYTHTIHFIYMHYILYIYIWNICVCIYIFISYWSFPILVCQSWSLPTIIRVSLSWRWCWCPASFDGLCYKKIHVHGEKSKASEYWACIFLSSSFEGSTLLFCKAINLLKISWFHWETEFMLYDSRS